MPGSFLLTAAPNGQAWAQYCSYGPPMLDQMGLVAGPWGECMHWAVVFEMTNSGWDSMPEYSNEGPAGQVISYLAERGYSNFTPNMERNEEATRSLLEQGRQGYAFQVMGAQPFGGPAPSQFGQPAMGGTAQVTGVPAHPGAPGSGIVMGVPFSQRLDQAVENGAFEGKTSVDQVQKGGEVLERYPHFPEERPCRDALWAVLFLLLGVALVGTMGYFAQEIPKQATRIGTRYESFVGKACNMVAMTTWPSGEQIRSTGLQQRLMDANTTRRLFEDQEFEEEDDDFITAGDVVTSNPVAEIELPGLTTFVRRLQLLKVPGAFSTLIAVEEAWENSESPAAAARQLFRSSARRRRSTQQAPPKEADCERACSAFEECAGFNVVRSSGLASCTYQKMPAGATSPPALRTLMSNSANSACWRKIDAEDTNDQAKTVVGYIMGMAILGAFISMIVALAFVYWAAVMPAAATYAGVYFVPFCMVLIGLILIVVAFTLPYVIVALVIVGAALACCGSCLGACFWCCYRDLIPFTIEVIAAVTSVILRFKSMFVISVIGAIGAIGWSVLVVGATVGIQAYQSRLSATTPAAELTNPAQHLIYLQYFLWCMVYYWGAFVFFNLCHVTYCGIFGAWYFGKDKEGGLVCGSMTIALTKSFGTVCLGSLVIAAIRALEAMLRKMKDDASESGNTFACVVACIMESIVSCIGDILEWISTYVYVQVAIRGVGFLDGARATYALAKVSNLTYVVSQMLCEWVALMGAILCGIIGGIIAGGVGYLAVAVPEWRLVLALVGGILGLIAGCIAGGGAVGTINSGAASILMCWAEVPEVLSSTQPELHRKFNEKLVKDGDGDDFCG